MRSARAVNRVAIRIEQFDVNLVKRLLAHARRPPKFGMFDFELAAALPI